MEKNNKTHFLFVLHSDKTWVFDQSEIAQGSICTITVFKKLEFFYVYE